MKAFILAASTALLWGIAPLFEKVGLAKIDPSLGVILRGLAVFIGVIFAAAWIYRPGAQNNGFLAAINGVDKVAVLFIFAGGLIATLFGQMFFYRALKMGEASTIVPVAASYPVITFLLGTLFLGESFTLPKVFGLILVMSGVYFLR